MQSASTKTFSVNFPSVYGHILTLRESIQAEHRKDDNCLSYINISLQELSFYDYYEGEDLTTRFRESCLEERGTVEVIADKTLPVAGYLSDIRIAQSPDGNFYYFGLVIIGNEYGYTITGDCTIDSREFYEPLFDEIWQSIRNVEAPAKKQQDQDDKTIAPPAVSVDEGNYRQTAHHMSTGATDNIVRELRLTDPNPDTLAETISPLSQLQILSIDFRNTKLAAGFKVIPEAVRHLKNLRELSLWGVCALDNLPEWLNELKNLEMICLSDSKVESLPVLQLPLLKKLFLSDNQLRTIPPALPENLETLVVRSNRITSLPASVNRLQYLNIENNPLQELPAGLENIPILNLELEKKMTMLDYAYKGADGLGTVPYDNNRFYARYDPELLQLLETEISAAGLDSFREGLINRSRRSLALATTEADTYQVKGNHRFGGLPDLPPGVNYPSFIDWEEQVRGLQFIAQINCAAVAHLQDYLPRTGVLYFFIKDQEEVEPTVLYYDGNSSDLQSAKDLNFNKDFIYDIHGIYTPFQAEAGVYPGIPVMYDTSRLYPELEEMEEMYDEVEQLNKGLNASSVASVHTLNSYVFKQHGTPEMEAANAKRGHPEEWMVLLKVGTDSNPGFSFWDAGEIYFVIHKSDLEKRDFSNVFCGLESS